MNENLSKEKLINCNIYNFSEFSYINSSLTIFFFVFLFFYVIVFLYVSFTV